MQLAEAEQMLADYLGGMRQSQLIEKYSVSRPTVQHRRNAALDARIAPTVDQYRDNQNAHLDELMGPAVTLAARSTRGKNFMGAPFGATTKSCGRPAKPSHLS